MQEQTDFSLTITESLQSSFVNFYMLKKSLDSFCNFKGLMLLMAYQGSNLKSKLNEGKPFQSGYSHSAT